MVSRQFIAENSSEIQQTDFFNCELFAVPPNPSSTKMQTYAFDFVT
jgi:hypothetical protein